MLVAGAFLAGNAIADEVYRWVDENGDVHYSESLPPDFKDKGHDVLSERGIVLDEDLILTPEVPKEVPDEEEPQELPRDSSGMQRPKALYSEAEMQRRMDNFLMLRYDSEQEITDAMNVEIKQLAYDRRLLETEKVTQEIRQLQARLVEGNQSLKLLEARELSIRAEFGKQLDRYRFLEKEWAEESGDS
jgi:hypothetical protein